MTNPYMEPLVLLPVIIDEVGDYVTRGGSDVTITDVSHKHDFNNHGVYEEDGVPDSWHKSGRVFANRESYHDIVKKK